MLAGRLALGGGLTGSSSSASVAESTVLFPGLRLELRAEVSRELASVGLCLLLSPQV